MTTNLQVAETTLSQLGGVGRLTAMIGAKHFTGDATSLTFKFAAKARNASNCLRVTLTPADTYTVEFIAVRGLKVATKSVHEVYADQLRALFERETGLYLTF